MIKKKICLLGAFAVGKTSLVRRFVSGFFEERYMSTIGVKIDRRSLRVGGREIDLIIWDIAGGVPESCASPVYLSGLAGYLIVGDGTRPVTCEAAVDLIKYVGDQEGVKPNILLLNKVDLTSDWRLDDAREEELKNSVGLLLKTSAKTGNQVDTALTAIAEMMIAEDLRHGKDRGTLL